MLREMEGLSLSDFQREMGVEIRGTSLTKELEEAQTVASNAYNAPPSTREVL